MGEVVNKGGAKMRAGQALRGSSEFHAWGDSNLYLRRHGEQLTLTVEHRAAAAISAVSLSYLEVANPSAHGLGRRRIRRRCAPAARRDPDARRPGLCRPRPSHSSRRRQ